MEFANEAYQFQYKPHSAASNYLYLFVLENLCILFILYFKQSSNRAETELKCNTGIKRNHIPSALSYTDSWCVVPFSSNISWTVIMK